MDVVNSAVSRGTLPKFITEGPVEWEEQNAKKRGQHLMLYSFTPTVIQRLKATEKLLCKMGGFFTRQTTP